MANQQRTVRFSSSVEVISNTDDDVIDRSFLSTDRLVAGDGAEELVESTISPNRSAWNSTERAFFSNNRVDMTPRQPQRTLDSILDDAINTCEELIAMSPVDGEGRIGDNLSPPQISGRHVRLDRSLFCIRSDLPFPQPPPLSTSSNVRQALKEIMQ